MHWRTNNATGTMCNNLGYDPPMHADFVVQDRLSGSGHEANFGVALDSLS
jgi:hypothetical protein